MLNDFVETPQKEVQRNMALASGNLSDTYKFNSNQPHATVLILRTEA
jgi:hypothetical protein